MRDEFVFLSLSRNNNNRKPSLKSESVDFVGTWEGFGIVNKGKIAGTTAFDKALAKIQENF